VIMGTPLMVRAFSPNPPPGRADRVAGLACRRPGHLDGPCALGSRRLLGQHPAVHDRPPHQGPGPLEVSTPLSHTACMHGTPGKGLLLLLKATTTLCVAPLHSPAAQIPHLAAPHHGRIRVPARRPVGPRPQWLRGPGRPRPVMPGRAPGAHPPASVACGGIGTHRRAARRRPTEVGAGG
jgi:hypothetical protein